MKKINLAVTGCMGRMGRQIIKSAKLDKNFKLVSLTEGKKINKKISGIRIELNTEKEKIYAVSEIKDYCKRSPTEIKNSIIYDLIDETILGPGDFTAVAPNHYHTFEGLEDGVAFELYWAKFDHNDIQRENVGHLKTGNVVRLDKKKGK